LKLRATQTLDTLFIALTTVLLAWQLLIPPALSVADDNDFQRVAGNYCLGQSPGTGPVLFDYTNLHWYFYPAACIHWPFRSAVQGVFVTAMGLNRLFTSDVEFDLRWMGVVYMAIFLAGFVYLQQAMSSLPRASSVAMQTAYMLVVCNAVYIPYFNTLYFDALTLATLTAAVAGLCLIVLRTRVTAVTMLIASAWLALVAGSKSQHAPIALVCVPLFWTALGRRQFAPIWARAVATVLVVAAAAISLGSTPAVYGGSNAFDALFYRILPGVSDPAKYLAETRIPPSWIRYVGDHSFVPDSPLADESNLAHFTEWFGPADLTRFYIRHPVLAWRMAEINLGEASLDRVRMKTGALEHRLGNYEKSSGKGPQALSYFFCPWPAVKHAIIANRPRVYLIYILAVIVAAWTLAPRVERMPALLGCVTVCLAVAWAIPMLGGVDAGRHLTIFNFLLDLVVCADVGFAVHLLAPRLDFVARAFRAASIRRLERAHHSS
jgi:hypothetical protein